MGIRKKLMRSQSNADPANYLINFCKAKLILGWEVIVAVKFWSVQRTLCFTALQIRVNL